MTEEERATHVKSWTELKASWDQWKSDGRFPPLSWATQEYFVKASDAAVRVEFSKRRESLVGVPVPVGEGEAWSLILRYLLKSRKKSKDCLLDSIISRAIRKAWEKFGCGSDSEIRLESAIGWLLNSFRTRVVRDAIREYA